MESYAFPQNLKNFSEDLQAIAAQNVYMKLETEFLPALN